MKRMLTWSAVGVAGLVGWWYSPVSPRVPPAPVRLDGAAVEAASRAGTPVLPSDRSASAGCPMPPRAGDLAEPLQTAVPAGMRAFALRDATLEPLAGFSIDARVLSRRDYGFGRESDFSPTDLALGWGRMRDGAVADALDVRQGGRWYYYRWNAQPPIPADEIRLSSANMHMIPADDAVAAALHRVRAGQRVRLDGWLVQVDAGDGWRWRSSTSRGDTGQGACEVVYVCAVTRY